MDLAYLSYLAAHSETGAALFTSDEWSRAMHGGARAPGIAAFTLGAHDRRVGNPPRSLAEVTREVERMLSAETKATDPDEPATVLGQILGAWDLASSTADAYTRIGNILRSGGYIDDDDVLTTAGRATAYQERA